MRMIRAGGQMIRPSKLLQSWMFEPRMIGGVAIGMQFLLS